MTTIALVTGTVRMVDWVIEDHGGHGYVYEVEIEVVG